MYNNCSRIPVFKGFSNESSRYMIYYASSTYNINNIPANPTYGVYISQLIRISRICDTFQSFVLRHRLLTERLIKQGFWYSKLCKYFKKFVSRHNALFSKYGVSVRTHEHEGICICLVVKHELSKHITTSRCHSSYLIF